MLAEELHPSDTQLLNARTDLQVDARTDLASLPLPVNLSDPLRSCSPLWCTLFLDDNGNKGSGSSWKDPHPSYWAIQNMVHSLFSPISDKLAL